MLRAYPPLVSYSREGTKIWKRPMSPFLQIIAPIPSIGDSWRIISWKYSLILAYKSHNNKNDLDLHVGRLNAGLPWYQNSRNSYKQLLLKSLVGKLCMSSLLTYVRNWIHLLEDFGVYVVDIYNYTRWKEIAELYPWPKLKNPFHQII